MICNLLSFSEQIEAIKQLQKDKLWGGGGSSFSDSITPHFILLTRSEIVRQTGVSMDSV